MRGLCVIWLAAAVMLAGRLACPFDSAAEEARTSPERTASLDLASQVVIYRDAWGVPHIDGANDEAAVFGFAYAQAEDYFWQVEDNYLLALGRYSEAHGPEGLNSDLLNRAFEIVPRAKKDFPRLEPGLRSLCEAFVSGLNYFLETHPHVKPRLISRFEPWHVVAIGRQLMLELTFRYTRIHSNYMPRVNPIIAAATGSNAWAVAPRRTQAGHAMLFANPHQPWFGFGQMYEAHLRSGEGWSFTGATFFGSPLPTMGHNEQLGFSFTTNEPDIADLWRETFDDPAHPLRYRYGNDYRTAVEWQAPVKIKTAAGMSERSYTFRKTHHGPIVAKEDGEHQLSARVGRLEESLLLKQMDMLVRAKNVDDFRAGMAGLNFPIMNAVYADRAGHIYFLYNGTIPKRDPGFDWSKPVDGADPRTEWQGFHGIDDLPQLLDPAAGYVQNCNSSPFTTTDDENPAEADFPPYMVEDKHDDKRRAKRSREILSAFDGITFDELRESAFDTKIYWADHELPKYAEAWEGLKQTQPELAARVKPYIEHLLDWDCRSTIESTQTALCVAWYEELYGGGYPGEQLKPRYAGNVPLQLEGLGKAALHLQAVHGNWKVPYGEIYRIQRHASAADLMTVPFDDGQPSLPCAGTHGPMGVIFTQYYTPTVKIPFVKTASRHYGLIGYTYVGVFEFGDRVKGATLVQFGESGDPKSPHFFDQARLLSSRQLKPELFYWEDVLSAATSGYHPGQRPQSPREGERLAEPINKVGPVKK